ncbi:MAG: three-Cys-motif partner protein TcmP [Candidatus Anammoxibacter sp.]
MKKDKEFDVKTVMLKHSKAKVDLYTNYLSVYLNILSRARFLDKIHIYDLMCGEGIYLDNSKGSPIVALEKIKDHYFSNNKTCPNLEIWFNDRDKSEIEKHKYKIDRVKEYCSKIFTPPNVNIKYTKKDYSKIYNEVLNGINALKDERLLLFIDLYGYKEIKPEHLKNFLKGGKTELILFLPTSPMYRFANKSLSEDEFPGGCHLKEFLLSLFKQETESYNSIEEFINQLKVSFRLYLKEQKIFVDTFTIERDRQNVYCLFFFTPHIKGFEAMLDTKWKIDEQQGKGFKLSAKQLLFSEVQITNYPEKLEQYILQTNFRTNGEIYSFGLDNGFLPKHTGEVFKEWQKSKEKFKIYLEDGQDARKNSFYISYKNYGNNPDKRVKFVLEK